MLLELCVLVNKVRSSVKMDLIHLNYPNTLSLKGIPLVVQNSSSTWYRFKGDEPISGRVQKLFSNSFKVILHASYIIKCSYLCTIFLEGELFNKKTFLRK